MGITPNSITSNSQFIGNLCNKLEGGLSSTSDHCVPTPEWFSFYSGSKVLQDLCQEYDQISELAGPQIEKLGTILTKLDLTAAPDHCVGQGLMVPLAESTKTQIEELAREALSLGPSSPKVPRGDSYPCDWITQEKQYDQSKILQMIRHEMHINEPSQEQLKGKDGWFSRNQIEGKQRSPMEHGFYSELDCWRRTRDSDTYDWVSKAKSLPNSLSFCHTPGYDSYYDDKSCDRWGDFVMPVVVSCDLSKQESVTCKGHLPHQKGNLVYEAKEVFGEKGSSTITESIFNSKDDGVISSLTYLIKGREKPKALSQLLDTKTLDKSMDVKTCRYNPPNPLTGKAY